jgi:hypothetical protein
LEIVSDRNMYSALLNIGQNNCENHLTICFEYKGLFCIETYLSDVFPLIVTKKDIINDNTQSISRYNHDKVY